MSGWQWDSRLKISVENKYEKKYLFTVFFYSVFLSIYGWVIKYSLTWLITYIPIYKFSSSTLGGGLNNNQSESICLFDLCKRWITKERERKKNFVSPLKVQETHLP